MKPGQNKFILYVHAKSEHKALHFKLIVWIQNKTKQNKIEFVIVCVCVPACVLVSTRTSIALMVYRKTVPKSTSLMLLLVRFVQFFTNPNDYIDGTTMMTKPHFRCNDITEMKKKGILTAKYIYLSYSQWRQLPACIQRMCVCVCLRESLLNILTGDTLISMASLIWFSFSLTVCAYVYTHRLAFPERVYFANSFSKCTYTHTHTFTTKKRTNKTTH